MRIEGMVLSLREETFSKKDIIEIQISKEDFDTLMAASHFGDEYEICGKTVVMYDEETDKEKAIESFDNDQYYKILEMKVNRLENALKDLGYQPIYLDRQGKGGTL